MCGLLARQRGLLGLLGARSAKGGAVGVGRERRAVCIRVKAELGVSGVGVVFRFFVHFAWSRLRFGNGILSAGLELLYNH